MPLTPSTATSYPCPECGYDLRAATGDICPECGSEIVRRSFSRSSQIQNQSDGVIESLSQIRRGIDWSLVIWLGCVAVPLIGQLAWVVLALVSGWRMFALWHLRQTQFLDSFKQHESLRTWPRMMIAEFAVAIFAGIFTIIASMNNMPIALVAVLILARIAWLGLVSVNNFSALTLALSMTQKFDGEPCKPFFRFAPIAIFGAPLLSLPYFTFRIIDSLAKTPAWINTITLFVFVFACIFGIASVIMVHAALEGASDAFIDSRRTRSPKPNRTASLSRPILKQPHFPDPPPAPGDGDVIPFADDPPDPQR